VKIGGGYAQLHEYIEREAPAEQAKINELLIRGQWDLEELVAQYKADLNKDQIV